MGVQGTNGHRLEGKVAVITGGSTGMGLATAKRFVQEGVDHVFITGRRKDALDTAVAEIGRNVTAVQGDVANLADLDRLYDAVKKQNRQIDVVFVNAGLAARRTARSSGFCCPPAREAPFDVFPFVSSCERK